MGKTNSLRGNPHQTSAYRQGYPLTPSRGKGRGCADGNSRVTLKGHQLFINPLHKVQSVDYADLVSIFVCA